MPKRITVDKVLEVYDKYKLVPVTGAYLHDNHRVCPLTAMYIDHNKVDLEHDFTLDENTIDEWNYFGKEYTLGFIVGYDSSYSYSGTRCRAEELLGYQDGLAVKNALREKFPKYFGEVYNE